jgi:hypothetical protein
MKDGRGEASAPTDGDQISPTYFNTHLEFCGVAPMTIPFLGKFRQRDSSEHRPETPATTSIEIAQRAMADPSGAGLAPLAAALQDIVLHEAWRRNTAVPSGALFLSFGEFAIAEAPYGLGVSSIPAARLLRHALFEEGLLRPWTEVLELIARKPGRPETLESRGFRALLYRTDIYDVTRSPAPEVEARSSRDLPKGMRRRMYYT